MTTLTIPSNITITYVVATTTVPATSRAARKLAVASICQEIRRAVNAWLYS
jgi:hypothetical protein